MGKGQLHRHHHDSQHYVSRRKNGTASAFASGDTLTGVSPVLQSQENQVALVPKRSPLPYDNEEQMQRLMSALMRLRKYVPRERWTKFYEVYHKIELFLNSRSDFLIDFFTKKVQLDPEALQTLLQHGPQILEHAIRLCSIQPAMLEAAPVKVSNSQYENNFEQIQELGRGGYGTVFRSKSLLDEQEYAIKKIPLHVRSPDEYNKLINECRCHAQLTHPNVVRYHHSWVELTNDPQTISTSEGGSIWNNSDLGTLRHRISEVFDESDSDESTDKAIFSPLPVVSVFNSDDEIMDSTQIETDEDESSSTTTTTTTASGKGFFRTPSGASVSSFSSDDEMDDDTDASMHSSDARNKALQIFEAAENDDGLGRSLTEHPDFPPLNAFHNSQRPRLQPMTLFIQMELCRNTLESCLNQRSTVDTDFNESIIEGLLSAVAFLHENNVVHRDIKPSNIFIKDVNGQPSALLGDFGLARCIEQLAVPDKRKLPRSPLLESTMSRKMTVGCGTQLYAAPEQLSSDQYSVLADVFSAGLVIFEMYNIFGTQHERIKTLVDVRHAKIAPEFTAKWPHIHELVVSMVASNPRERVSAASSLNQFSKMKLADLKQLQAENIRLQAENARHQAEVARLRRQVRTLKKKQKKKNK